MTKRFLVITLLAILCGAAYAQTDENCPALKNPLSFTSGSHSYNNAGYYSGGTGNKPSIAPNALTGVTGVNITNDNISDNQLANTTDNGSSSYCGTSLDASHQFRIMTTTDGPGTGSNAGKDPLVSYNLPYCPTSYDNTINRSIRLGNCQVSAHAEALYYTMDVKTENALLFIYYAIVVQAPGHGPSGDPSFVIRVAKKNSSNQWVQISDTLCYAVSSSGLVNGTNGWHSYSGSGGSGFYRDWNKVAINLNKYIYEQVRIEIYIGDCSASGHYGYAYIAGDCQAMQIATSGCPAGATTTVQTLTAPTGLTSYRWYRSGVDGNDIPSLNGDMTQYPFNTITGATSNVYNCQVEDFRVAQGDNAGQLTNNMVFRCDMTSAMDPAKPFTSSVYVRVNNTKPLMFVDTTKNCDRHLHLTNKSYVPGLTCDTAHSKYWIYSGWDMVNDTVMDSIQNVGDMRYTFPARGRYAVKVRSYYYDGTADAGHQYDCYSDSTYRVTILGRPTPILTIDPKDLCIDPPDQTIIKDETVGGYRRDWNIDGNWVNNGQQTLPARSFDQKVNPIGLCAYNGLSHPDSVNPNLTVFCTDTVWDTVKVFVSPDIYREGDSVVCEGEYTTISVSTPTEGCYWKWFYDRDCNNLVPGHEGTNQLHVQPGGDSAYYYVQVRSPKGCIAVDSVKTMVVRPTLTINTHDICAGDSARLTAGAAALYKWVAVPEDTSLTAQLDSLGQGPEVVVVKPQETTTYSMIGMGNNGCESTAKQETLTVHPMPIARFSTNPSFIDSDDPVVTFNDNSSYSVSNRWVFGDDTSLYTGSPLAHNFGELSDTVMPCRLIVQNDLGCADTHDAVLPVVLFTFYAPNIFTPDRPDNNTFFIRSANALEHFRVFIYDRQGRQVYTANTMDFEWDGKCGDLLCPQGAYVYIITYRRPGTEDIVTQKGTIMLVR